MPESSGKNINGTDAMKKLLFLCLLLLANVTVTRADTRTPGFADFPVADIYSGRPAKVRLVSPQDRQFATRIREAGRQKVNFAGHFILANWGCGASCLMTVVIDAKTGTVVWLPFTVCCWDADVDEPIAFRRDSRLIVVHGSRNETGGGTYYYVFERGQFVLLKAVESPTT
jgi:hypothetical protein